MARQAIARAETVASGRQGRVRWPRRVAGRAGVLMLATALLILASAARADPDPPPPPAAGFGLTGDWGGLRTRLATDGLTINAGYISEFAYNARGGVRRELDEAGEIDLGVTADLQRLAGVPGGVFRVTLTDRRGKELGQDTGLGLLQEVQEINGRGHTWRITEFWYEQALGPVRLKVGRSPPNTDFSAFSCDFQNLSLCSAAAGNTVTSTWFNWPIGQWSARLRVDGRRGYVQAGAYEINPRDLEPRFILAHSGGEAGVLYPVEIGWTPTLAGRPGSYKFGAWRSTADTPPRGPTAAGPAGPAGPADPFTPPRTSRSGGWVNFEQQLSGAATGRGGPGLSAFFNLTQADRRTAQIDQQIAAGLVYTGLLPGRPQDVVGLGLARTHLNNSAGADLLGPGAPRGPEGAEGLAEAYYSYRSRPWLSLSPNIQVIHHPGGQETRGAVVVFGLKAGLKL